MRSPDRRALAVWLAITAAAGCTDQTDTSPTASPSPSIAQGSTPADRAASLTTPARPSATTLPAPQTSSAPVQVSGGDLPAKLLDGYDHNGGDLVDPAEWRSRFGRGPLPQLTGPGVRLVEGVRRWELRSGRWLQTDEAGWLLMSRDDRDAMMRSLADAATIQAPSSRRSSGEQGADCVRDTYRPVDGVTWQVQGCSYHQFPGLLSLGISRHGPATETALVVDATITAVANAIDGSVTFVEAQFGQPGPDRSTVRLSAHVASGLALEPAAAAVAGGPLAGWQTFPGDGSVLLSGPTGATWTLSDGAAVFTWAGRW